MEPFTSHPLALPHLPLTLAVTPAHPPKAATHAVAKAAPTILLILIVANPRSFKPVIGHGFIEYGGGGASRASSTTQHVEIVVSLAALKYAPAPVATDHS